MPDGCAVLGSDQGQEPTETDLDAISSSTEIEALASYMRQGMIGRDALVERLMIGVLTGRHVLIEGAPGLGKTRAVKLLANGLNVSFARVQCTPDLMPADLTGTPVYRQDSGRFEFVEGPLFNSIVLVDEINRAPPKVQSALLEAMAERQVTSGGKTYPLPDPFIVFATQNPIEHEGTFPLPEAQLDRFLLHVSLDHPGAADETRILDLVEGETGDVIAAHDTPMSVSEIIAAREAAARVHLSPVLKDYIVRLVTATRPEGGIPEIVSRIEHPVSPRGSIALAAAAKARAFLHGRDYATPEDVSELAADALSHRMVMQWRASAEGETPRGVIADLLTRVEAL